MIISEDDLFLTDPCTEGRLLVKEVTRNSASWVTRPLTSGTCSYCLPSVRSVGVMFRTESLSS